MEAGSICEKCRHAIRCSVEEFPEDYWFVCDLPEVDDVRMPLHLQECPYFSEKLEG